MAAVTLYVGFAQLLLCRRQVRRRHHFLFALACLLVSVYDVFAAGLYGASSLAEGVIWQRAQLAVLPLLGLAVVWFVHDYSFLRNKRTFYAFALYFLLAAAAGLVAPDGLLLADRPAGKRVDLPFGAQVVYWEAAPGPLSAVQGAMGIVALAYVFAVAIQGFRYHDRRKYRPLLAALALFCIGVLNDIAVHAGLYEFLYLIEYSFMGMVVLMAFALAEEVTTAIAAQKQLRAGHERFSAVFKNAAVGIALVDARKRLLTANDAIRGMLGRSAAESAKTLLPECIHPDDRSEILPSVNAVLDGSLGAFRRECRYVRADGQAFWGDMSFGVVHSAQGGIAGMIWIVVGVTERRRAVEQLRGLNESLERKVAARTEELETANARLSESLAVLKEDEEAARRIQFNLLPEESRTIGQYEFSRYLAPSMYVSGDFVSYFEIDERHCGFYMADVSGHGVSSAFITVLLYSFIQNSIANHVSEQDPTILDPKSVLAKLNAELVAKGGGKYVAIFFGVLDRGDNSLTFANGGQFPLPTIRSGGRLQTIAATGPAVGLFEFSTYQNARMPLPDEFTLFACSDGVLDVLPPKTIAEKLSCLTSMLDAPDRTIAEMVDRIGIGGRESLPDDIAMLAIRRKECRAGR